MAAERELGIEVDSGVSKSQDEADETLSTRHVALRKLAVIKKRDSRTHNSNTALSPKLGPESLLSLGLRREP